MAHIVLTLGEWRAIAYELRGIHPSAVPPGLTERLHAFFRETPFTGQGEPCAIDLDARSIETVWEMHAIVTSSRPAGSNRHDGFLAAMQSIYQHHQTADDFSPAS